MKTLNDIIMPIVWAFFAVMLMVAVANADICMDAQTAGKLIVEVEQGRVSSDICAIKDEQIQVLNQQREELQKIIALKDEQLSIKDGAITSLNGLVERQKDDCNAMLKESKPSFFRQILSGLGFIGAGILIGVLAL
jgi:hypothetical protein